MSSIPRYPRPTSNSRMTVSPKKLFFYNSDGNEFLNPHLWIVIRLSTYLEANHIEVVLKLMVFMALYSRSITVATHSAADSGKPMPAPCDWIKIVFPIENKAASKLCSTMVMSCCADTKIAPRHFTLPFLHATLFPCKKLSSKYCASNASFFFQERT